MAPLSANAGEVFQLNGGGQRKGVSDGYSYELWIDNTGGSGSMTLNAGGAFDTEWNCSVPKGNFLARRGMDFVQDNKKATSYDNITLDYDATYTASSEGNSRLCVYGWFAEQTAPQISGAVVEYYIIEDWKNWCPQPDGQSQTVTIDGAQYEIFRIKHYGPTIRSGGSSEEFWQYFSIRKDKRTSGTISVSDHFAAWEKAGFDIYNLYEVALNAEGWESSGSAKVSKLEMSVGGPPKPTDPPTPTEPPTEPADGYYMQEGFESGAGKWTSRGDNVKVASSSTGASGKGLAVTGRSDNWHGAAIELSAKDYVPGNSYSFSVMGMQNTSASDTLKLTLQYNLNGTENYDNVAEATAAKGEWVQLSNANFTIPAGASNMVLYVEADSKTNDFFIDDAAIATKGTKIAASGTGSSGDPAGVLLGDVNSDGSVNVLDIITMQKYMLGAKTTMSFEAADINKDNVIDIFDLALLKQMVLFPKAQPPVETPTEAPTEAPTQAPVEVPQRKEGYYYNLADVSWIDPNKPMVAFAFDDGPIGGADANNVTRIQNAVSEGGGHATFFYWGQRIAGNEQEILRAKQLGFEIANHTWTHTNLTEVDVNTMKQEIGQCAAKLQEITGQEDFLVRPPFLGVNATVQQNCGVALVNCGIDSGDWQDFTTTQQIIDKYTQAAANGSLNGQVLLMHENYGKTADAVEYLVPYLKAQGYQIVSVGEMFKAKGIDMQYGQVYNKLP